MEFIELLIDKSTLIKEAMKKIGQSVPKILFVVDDNKLYGSLSDGDIRRYLISGGTIMDSVSKACNRDTKVAKNLIEAKQILSKHFVAIPIIGTDRKIKDIYIGNSNYKEEYNNIKMKWKEKNIYVM